MIPLTWLIGGSVALAAISGAYFAGDSAGANRVIVRDAKAMGKAVAAMERGRAAIETVSARGAVAQQEQAVETREIVRESVRIVDRPVYRSVCVDADGGRLLDRAAANANRGLAGASASDAAVAAEDAARR